MRPSRRLTALRWAARNIQKPLMARATSPYVHRFVAEVAARAVLRGRKPFAFHWENRGEARLRVGPGGPGTLFYIHGGAFTMFSPQTHQGLAARMAAPLGLRPVLPAYGRAPENVFPQALDQVDAAWASIEDAPGPLVLAGDSAGGGLSMGLVQKLLARGGRLPDAVVLFSPWVDLTLSGESHGTNAESDPLIPSSNMAIVVDQYLGGTPPRDPLASPVFGDFRGAPPVLIQACPDEVLFSDSQALTAALRKSGVEVSLEEIPNGIHAIQLLHGWLPEADRALSQVDAFLTRTLAG